MDHGLETSIGFAGSHGDPLELLEFTEEVLNEVTPFVDFGVDRDGTCASWMLGNDDLRAPLVEIGDDVIAVEGLVRYEGLERDTVDQRSNTDAVEAMARHQPEAHEISQSVGQSQDLGGHTALGTTYGLTLSPPFAPWPWR